MYWTDELQVIELISKAKEKLPKGYPLRTVDQESGMLIQLVRRDVAHLDKADMTRIAETLHQLTLDINKTGIPCAIEIIQ